MDGSVHTVTPLSFQSTLSVRRATPDGRETGLEIVISIHALREESDLTALRNPFIEGKISIHALREESDLRFRRDDLVCKISIHALREESDLRFRRDDLVCKISIHALREESDSVRAWYGPGRRYFNPRSP